MKVEVTVKKRKQEIRGAQERRGTHQSGKSAVLVGTERPDRT